MFVDVIIPAIVAGLVVAAIVGTVKLLPKAITRFRRNGFIGFFTGYSKPPKFCFVPLDSAGEVNECSQTESYLLSVDHETGEIRRY